jgi:hypothetical protein
MIGGKQEEGREGQQTLKKKDWTMIQGEDG